VLDEETGYQFAVSDYVAPNENVASQVGSLPGVAFWSSETFTKTGVGAWSQADFDNITFNGYAAPEIASDHMVTLANN